MTETLEEKALYEQVLAEVQVAAERCSFGPVWEKDFYPLRDRDLGDFATDFSFRVAKEQGRRPQEIARRVEQELRELPGIMAHQAEGYLNFSHQQGQELFVEDNKDGLKKRQEEDFIVCHFAAGADERARVRYGAYAWQQALLGGHFFSSVRFLTAGGKVCKGPLSPGSEHWLLDAVSPSRYPLPEILTKEIDSPKKVYCHVWLYGESSETKLFSSWLKTLAPEIRENVFVHVLNKKLIYGFDACPGIEEIISWDSAAKQALSLLLASDDPAREQDFFVAQLKERANILWYAAAVEERLQRFPTPAFSPCSSLASQEIPPKLWQLGHRRRYLPYFFQQGAQRGSVGGALSVWREYLVLVDRFLNNRDFRTRFAEERLFLYEIKILSSVKQTLSDMLSSFGALRRV